MQDSDLFRQSQGEAMGPILRNAVRVTSRDLGVASVARHDGKDEASDNPWRERIDRHASRGVDQCL
jgi:hypothetical protein